MAYGDFKDLNRRTALDDGYQRGLASMVYKFFDKKTFGGSATLARLEMRNKSAI